MKFSLFLAFIILSVSLPTFAYISDDDTGELKIAYPEEEISIFDESRIHLGISLIQSMQDYSIAPGVRERGGLKGFQLGLGVDFFSPNWIVEGTIMNFPHARINDTDLSFTGFELRALYEKPVLYGVTVHGGAGVANRVYNLKTRERANVSQTDKNFSSGASVLILGMNYWPSGEVSAGIEMSHHIPMATGDDPSSIDFSFKLTGHF